MKTIDAQYEIVSHMFLGDADQNAGHIRGASVKGALAFWWRAINYAKFLEQANLDHKDALKKMRERECAIFGGPNGQGAFLMTVSDDWGEEKKKTFSAVLTEAKDTTGIQYFGYGLDKKRTCIKPNSKFILKLIAKPNVDVSIMNELYQCLIMLGTLGGLGSRVRRSWGSLNLEELTTNVNSISQEWTVPTDINSYKKLLKTIVGYTRSVDMSCAPLTAFGKETISKIGLKDFDDGIEALNFVGKELLRYRG